MLGRKVIYRRCINCSYNNVAKGIRIPDNKAFLFIQEKLQLNRLLSTSTVRLSDGIRVITF